MQFWGGNRAIPLQILNLLEADCPSDESINSRTIEFLRFCHTESSRNTKTDISRDNRGATSLSKEIYKEAR